MDLERKEFTPKKEDKHNQSSKNRVSNSKSRSLINLIYLFLKNIEFFYIQITFNGFRDIYLFIWKMYSDL